MRGLMRSDASGEAEATTAVPEDQQLLLVASALVLVAILVYAVWVFSGEVDPFATDATADWLVVNAAVDGLDPYEDLQTLGQSY
ncbi:MAG: hypothetical protein PVG83_05640, partial [Acidimicrobiia bacterium]